MTEGFESTRLSVRTELRRAWTLFKEAFQIVIVGPCVITGGLLLASSGFSPTELARQWYEAQASIAALPKAKAGFLSVEECRSEPMYSESPPAVIVECRHPIIKEVAIDDLAERSGESIGRAWFLFALLGLGGRMLFSTRWWPARPSRKDED